MARKIAVEIVGDASSLERAFKKSSRSASNFNKDIDKTGKKKGVFGDLKKSAAGAAAGFVGIGAAVGAVKSSITAASDLNEEISKSRVIFKDSSKGLEDWSKTTANALGISRADALKATGTFGNMLRPMGFARGKAADMSKEMVNLAGDMASFNNASPQETLDALGAGLRGESEPLQRFGVNLRVAALEQFALSKGIKKAVKDMTSQEKAQLVHNKILNDTKDAQGDAARTGDSWAGVQRRLKALVEDLSAKLGGSLVPALADSAGKLADWLAKSKNQKAIVNGFRDAVSTLKDVLNFLKQAVGPLKGAFQLLSGAVGGNANAVKVLVGAYATWKVLSFAGRVGTLAGNIGTLTGRLRNGAGKVETFGNKATVAGGKTRGLAGKARGLSRSLVGKAGIAGAAGVAAYELTKMGLKFTGLDKKLYKSGENFRVWAEKVGLATDAMEKFEGKAAPSTEKFRSLRKQARGLYAQGLTSKQVVDRLARQNPSVSRTEIQSVAGARGPVTNIGNVILPSVTNFRQLEGEFTRRSKRRPHTRRG